MSDNKQLTRDAAEDNAWFPSPYSLSQYVAPKTDFDGTTTDKPYTGGKWKILLLATQERYLLMRDGRFFSTGNHPVETLLPLLHLDAAGFEVDVATLSGDPAKFEMWAFPAQDEAIKSVYDKYKAQFRKPKSLQELHAAGSFKDDKTPYIAVFVPGGHGAMNGLPHSALVGDVLRWAHANDRFYISLCHGPASMLAANVGKGESDDFIYKGYTVCVFPDALDKGANIDIGYVPGHLPWLVGEELEKLGVKLHNDKMSGATCRDRYVLTGDSPLASNALGKMAVEVLLDEAAKRK